MKRLLPLLALLALVLACCTPPPVTYAPVTAERPVTFPRDHYAHHDFRTEWWYHTGHFQTEDGGRYGFELVFFRHRTDGLVRFGGLWGGWPTGRVIAGRLAGVL